MNGIQSLLIIFWEWGNEEVVVVLSGFAGNGNGRGIYITNIAPSYHTKSNL
jgi:hypothetical protein